MNIKELDQAIVSNFVSSDLLDDTGIVVDDLLISKIVKSTCNVTDFIGSINGLTIDTIVPVYNFFDAFCVNPAFMEIVRHRLHVLSDTDVGNYDTIILKRHSYINAIQLDVPFRKIIDATKLISSYYDSSEKPEIFKIAKVVGSPSSEKVEIHYIDTNNIHYFRIATFIFDSIGKVVLVKGMNTTGYYHICSKYETRN